jgi:WD40 repeat protein
MKFERKFFVFIHFRKFVRLQVLFENTLFQCVAYHPEEYHIVTGGSDRKIAYWENLTGKQIRELEASKSAPINGLDIDNTGNHLVTAGGDKLVKVNFNLPLLIQKLIFLI